MVGSDRKLWQSEYRENSVLWGLNGSAIAQLERRSGSRLKTERVRGVGPTGAWSPAQVSFRRGSQGNKTLPSAPSLQSPLSSSQNQRARVKAEALEQGGEGGANGRDLPYLIHGSATPVSQWLTNSGHFALSVL